MVCILLNVFKPQQTCVQNGNYFVRTQCQTYRSSSSAVCLVPEKKFRNSWEHLCVQGNLTNSEAVFSSLLLISVTS